jgi:imidazolonepropionase
MTDRPETPALLLRHVGHAATLAGSAAPRVGAAQSELGLVQDAAILIEDGIITWVGRDAELPAVPVPREVPEFDLRGHLVTPGFVDAHTHVVWSGDRKDELEQRLMGADYEQIFARGGGILASVRATRGASEDDLFAQSVARVRRMIASGTTALEIKSGYGLHLGTERAQLRVARRLGDALGLAVRTTCLAAHAIPAEARGDDAARAAYVEHVVDEILPTLAREGLADYVDAFCDRGAFTVDESRRVLRAGLALGLRVRLHANELGPTGGAGLAAELHADSADHLLHVDEGDRAALAAAGVVAVLLPGTSLVLRKPYADGRAFVEAGVPVAVATDCNPGSCALESLLVAFALACHGNRLSPAEALVAITHNAAASLGWSRSRGRVEPGLTGDLVVLATDDLRDLAYHFGSPWVRATIVRGRVVAGALDRDAPDAPDVG